MVYKKQTQRKQTLGAPLEGGDVVFVSNDTTKSRAEGTKTRKTPKQDAKIGTAPESTPQTSKCYCTTH